MEPRKKRYLSAVLILTLAAFLVTGYGAMSSAGAGSNWTSAMYEKGGKHIRYLKPPSDRWAACESHAVSVAYYNKETGNVIACDVDLPSSQTDPQKAFQEFQEGLSKTFDGKMSILEERPVTVLGLPGYHAKVEATRAKDQSKLYFIHYFLVKDGKIITFDATQPANVDESKRQKDLETFNFFMNSVQSNY